jgi:hypothetical protein
VENMSDWLSDSYSSPGSDDISILDRKQEAISFIINEFNVHGKSKVRIRWIVEERMKVRSFVYSSDILEIYYALAETGDYNGTFMKYNEISDIIITRKPWHERHRYLFGFINSGIGFSATILVAFIIGVIFGKSCNQ